VIAPAARNDKIRMSNDERMTNSEERAGARFHSSFVIGHSSFRVSDAFTLIELIVVTAVIVILTGLVLSTVGYVQKKGARARAETEIAAMSAACEGYKADNGTYPRGPATAITIGSVTIPANVTDSLDARANGDPTSAIYGQTSLYLYTQLSGDLAGNRQATAKSYFALKPQMLSIDNSGLVTAIRDPFGNSYGYSTIQQTGTTTAGYNPTFDLWSTTGLTSGTNSTQWIKNW
jgi:prepilin-type N-terminal cleavage/methylation domain-containing protein